MKLECIEITKRNPDFGGFAEALTIAAENIKFQNTVHIKDGCFLESTNGHILKSQLLSGAYEPGCYKKIYRSNSKIFLVQAENSVRYPNFTNILDMSEYKNIYSFPSGQPQLAYFQLIRLPEKINIDYKYFNMVQGEIEVWFKDRKSAIIFKSLSDYNTTWAIMPMREE